MQEEYKFDEPIVPAVQTEIIATTVEVRTDPNGVAIVVDEEQTSEQVVNGVTDGIADGQHQQQIVEQLPTLFDMDLERMHADLYKGKYVVPQDFLDDVQKIVHNADIRMQEDPERFYKAQAMLTAAQVSINDFDPQLRLECDRMAPRERKRREERKKSRPKGKAPEDVANGATYAPGTRRSARNNGQQPELSITDPLKIERNLKRQRMPGTGGECVASEEDESDSRTTKRSKVILETSDDNDPLDILGPTSSQPQQMTVRFADVPPEGLSPIRESSPVAGPNEMTMDSEPVSQKTSGFDPALLNPMPPSTDFFSFSPSPNDVNGVLHASTSQLHPDQFQSSPQLSRASMSPPRTPVRGVGPPIPIPPDFLRRSPTPMIVERPPTPHPDFHVDEELLSSLKYSLRNRTSALTVEQLEQLRATCLSCVWRERSEWNRDRLVQELRNVVAEFIRQVGGV